jgi:hypothetical protein
MMTSEERRIDFYGAGDARAYDHDELYLMKEYAKDYHESEVKKFRLGAVSGQSELLLAFWDWYCKEDNVDNKYTANEMIDAFLASNSH